MQVLVVDSEFYTNHALEAAGMKGQEDASISITGASRVHHNIASNVGGGVGMANQASLHVDSSASILYNEADAGGGFFSESNKFDLHELQAVVRNNTAKSDQDVATTITSLNLITNDTIRDFVSRPAKIGSGADQGLLDVALNVSGFYGVPCQGITVSASMDGETISHSVSNKTGGVQMLLRIHRPPGVYNISFSIPEFPEVSNEVMMLEVRGCIKGEVTSPTNDTCQECLLGSYSLDPTHEMCEACPPEAFCPGGAVIQPILGSWHSAADSPQVQK